MVKVIKIASYILVIIGAINWGLVGIFNYNLVASLLGDMTYAARVVYSLVGVSAIISILTFNSCCHPNHNDK